MKKILIPTDFSEQATNATEFALDLAIKNSAELVFLHVVEYPTTSSFNVMGASSQGARLESDIFTVEMINSAKKKLEGLVDKYGAGITIHTRVEVGNPFSSISKILTDHNVDLIVMGTKGVSDLAEILIGSNTEKVVRYSKCPVITIKESRKLSDIKNIVYASNMNDDQLSVVASLKGIQEMLGATIHLLKVNTPGGFETTRELTKQLENFVSKAGLKNYTTNIYNDVNEEDGIMYFAEDINADMIALATHGRTGLSHLLSGSIAEDIVNHAKRPVWTLSLKR